MTEQDLVKKLFEELGIKIKMEEPRKAPSKPNNPDIPVEKTVSKSPIEPAKKPMTLIPEDVRGWINFWKNRSGSDYSSFLKSLLNAEGEVCDWIAQNPDDYSKAWEHGFKVDVPLFIVVFPNPDASPESKIFVLQRLGIDKWGENKVILSKVSNDVDLSLPQYNLTQKEIERVDPNYMIFSSPSNDF